MSTSPLGQPHGINYYLQDAALDLNKKIAAYLPGVCYAESCYMDDMCEWCQHLSGSEFIKNEHLKTTLERLAHEKDRPEKDRLPDSSLPELLDELVDEYVALASSYSDAKRGDNAGSEDLHGEDGPLTVLDELTLLCIHLQGQASIVLGSDDYLNQRDLDKIEAIDFHCWRPSSITKDWSEAFRDRIALVLATGGSIRFLAEGLDAKKIEECLVIFECLWTAANGDIKGIEPEFTKAFISKYSEDVDLREAGPVTYFEYVYLKFFDIPFQIINRQGEPAELSSPPDYDDNLS